MYHLHWKFPVRRSFLEQYEQWLVVVVGECLPITPLAAVFYTPHTRSIALVYIVVILLYLTVVAC